MKILPHEEAFTYRPAETLQARYKAYSTSSKQFACLQNQLPRRKLLEGRIERQARVRGWKAVQPRDPPPDRSVEGGAGRSIANNGKGNPSGSHSRLESRLEAAYYRANPAAFNGFLKLPAAVRVRVQVAGDRLS